MNPNISLPDLLEFIRRTSDAEFEQWLADPKRQPFSREDAAFAKIKANELDDLDERTRVRDCLTVLFRTDLFEFIRRASDVEFEQWLADPQRPHISTEDVSFSRAWSNTLASLDEGNRVFDRLARIPEIQTTPLSMALLFRMRANLYYGYEEFAQSLGAADQAIAVYRVHGVDFDIAVASVVKVFVLGSQGHYDDAINLAQWIHPYFANRRLRHALGQLALARGIAHTNAWRLKPALIDYRRALYHFSTLSNNRSLVSFALRNMGILANQMNRLEEAFQWLLEALSKTDKSETKNLVKTYSALGYNCTLREEYEEAINYLNKAREILAERDPDSSDNGFIDLDRASLCLILNQLEDAEHYAQAAHDRFKYLSLPLDQSEALLVLPRILGRSTDPTKQEKAFRAFESAEQIYVSHEMATAGALIQLERAELLLRIAAPPSEVIQAAEAALTIFKEDKLSLQQAQAHLLIGDACRAWSRAEAKEHYQSALKANRGRIELLTARAWYGLGWLANVEQRWGEAEGCYKRSLEALEKVRRNLRGHLHQVGFFEDKRPLTTALLGVMTGEVSQQQRVAIRLLGYIERSKAASLADLLFHLPPDTTLDEKTKILIAEWERLIKEFNQLQATQSRPESGGLKIKDPQMRSRAGEKPEQQERMTELRRQLQDIDEKLAQQQPSLAWRRGGSIDPKTICQALDSETLLVSYYTTSTPTGSSNDAPEKLYVLVAGSDRNDIHIYPIELPLSEISTLWRQTFAAMEWHYSTAEELSELQDRLGWLYTLLIHPFEAQLIGKKRLIILPEGEMSHIPFAALYNEEKGKYLVEQVVLQIAPSATVWLSCKRTPSGVYPPLLIGYAGKKGSNGYLPAVMPEIRALETLIGNVTKLVGIRATLQNFWKESKGRSIIHFASHGDFDPSQPLEAEIVLAKANPLRAWDLYQRFGYLSGSTVVISACETAQGSARGNDLLSLPSAFLYAGAVGVISGLWKVDDGATRKLMEEMYRSWSPSTDAASALQRAQLALLKKPKFSAPYLWSPFVLSGDSRCLVHKK